MTGRGLLATGGEVTLVAMPPSGETFIARDAQGVLWLVAPPGAGGPEVITDDVMTRAIADHGFDVVDEQCANWAELDDVRQRRTGTIDGPVLEVERYDAVDVRRVLTTIERLRTDNKVGRARRIAHVLLRAPVVREDSELYLTIVELLQQLDEAPVFHVPAPSTDPQKVSARRRMSLVS